MSKPPSLISLPQELTRAAETIEITAIRAEHFVLRQAPAYAERLRPGRQDNSAMSLIILQVKRDPISQVSFEEFLCRERDSNPHKR